MYSVFIKTTITLIFLFTLLLACVRRENIQGEGTFFLQGKWEESDTSNAEKQLNYTKHTFKFTCDSFYVDIITHAKANYYPDSCYNNGLAKEYAKGTYVMRNDTLVMLGVYTKANYKQKISGCFAIGQYLQSFLIEKNNPQTLEMRNLTNQQMMVFKLTEKIKCKPKKV